MRRVPPTPPSPIRSPAELWQERVRLLREKEQLTVEKRILELKVEKLQRQLWGRKSERLPRDDRQVVLFAEPAAAPTVPVWVVI